MKASINQRCIYREIGGKVLIEHLDEPLNRQVIGGSGVTIWRCLEKGFDTTEITNLLAGKYQLPAPRIESDLYDFLRELAQRKLIDAPGLNELAVSPAPKAGRDSAPVPAPSGEFNVYERLNREVEEQRMVIKAHIEITYACNFRCVQCYVGPLLNDRQIVKGQLTTQEVNDLITQLTDQGCMRITFTGGELFTRPDIIEVLQHTAAKRCAIRIQTNGSLITMEMARRLSEISTIETVEVSFFGMDGETSSMITRIKGSLERAIRAVSSLNHFGLPAYVKYVLMKQNQAGLEKARELAEKMGVRFITGIGNIYPTTTGGRKNLEYRLAETDVLKLVREGKIDGACPPADCSSSSWLCRAGIVRCTITPTGEVWPCERLPFSFGNIRRNSFKQIWFSERAEWYRAMIRQEHDACKMCSIRGYCYQCWAMPYLYGDGLSVEDALQFKGYTRFNCRLARINKKAYDLAKPARKARAVYSQVF